MMKIIFHICFFLEKTLVLSIICSKCKDEDEKLFKEEESIKKKFLVYLKIYNCFKNMAEENTSQEFTIKI